MKELPREAVSRSQPNCCFAPPSCHGVNVVADIRALHHLSTVAITVFRRCCGSVLIGFRPLSRNLNPCHFAYATNALAVL